MKSSPAPPANNVKPKTHLSLMKKVKRWAGKTSFHAIPHIAASKSNVVKVIWIIFLLISTVFCGYLLISETVKFLSFPVNTVVQITRDSNALFPAVTLCPVQQCEFESYEFKKYFDLYVQNELGYNLTDIYSEKMIDSKNVKELIDGTKKYFLKNHSRDDLDKILKSNESMKPYMISCQFSSEYCYDKDFETIQFDAFTRCFRFNGGKTYNGKSQYIRPARRYGKNYGLQLELYVGAPLRCRSPLSMNTGLIVYVHNQSQTMSSDNEAYVAQPGTETNIAIDRLRINRKEWPYSDCIKINDDMRNNPPNDMVRRTFKLAINYTQQSCLQLCYQTFLVKQYKCYDATMPYLEDEQSTPCGDESVEGNEKYFDKVEYYQKEENKNCLDQCPLECEETAFSAGVTSLQFPTVTYSEVLSYNENISAYFDDYRGINQINLIKASVLSINVYYKYDTFMEVREQPEALWIDFMSTIGGAVGVCLGISILSFVELIEIGIDHILEKCGWESKQKKKKASLKDPAKEQYDLQVKQQEQIELQKQQEMESQKNQAEQTKHDLNKISYEKIDASVINVKPATPDNSSDHSKA